MDSSINIALLEGQTDFKALKLASPLLRALEEENYLVPTPIQTQAIPHLLQKRDLLGCAQTGTGKTAAFALPILQRFTEQRIRPAARGCRALILAPTRELAMQIHQSFQRYGRFLSITQALVYGGVRMGPQAQAMSRGVDVLVATPGRLLDLMQQGRIRLETTEVLVFDEADRMLDMGFLPDIRKIVASLPTERQSIMFSATLPEEIRRLTGTFLRNPVQVSVTPPASTGERIQQKILFVDRKNKKALLHSVLQGREIGQALVFTRTKRGANQVAKGLNQIQIRADAIHGNKSQSARESTLEKFRRGTIRVLVATDLASRGLDVAGITHVINYELPEEAEIYVHRIGRTARAGAEGVALSFCDAQERSFLGNIEKKINRAVDVDAAHPFHCPSIARPAGRPKNGPGRNRRKSGGPVLTGKPSSIPRGWSGPDRPASGRKMSFRPRSSRV